MRIFRKVLISGGEGRGCGGVADLKFRAHHIQLYEGGLLLSSRDFTYGEDSFIVHVANMQPISGRYRPNKRQIA